MIPNSVDQQQVSEDWAAKGFSCGLWTDPPGQRWDDFVHATDELLMVVEGEMEVEIEGRCAMKTIVNIDVPAIGPAVEFYSAALGLRLNRILDEDVAELIGASSVIYLLQHAAGSKTASQSRISRDYARHWTPVHIDFVVEDVDKAAGQAEAVGAIRESECVEWRGSRCITFSDPFGHGFCLIEFTGDTYT